MSIYIFTYIYTYIIYIYIYVYTVCSLSIALFHKSLLVIQNQPGKCSLILSTIAVCVNRCGLVLGFLHRFGQDWNAPFNNHKLYNKKQEMIPGYNSFSLNPWFPEKKISMTILNPYPWEEDMTLKQLLYIFICPVRFIQLPKGSSSQLWFSSDLVDLLVGMRLYNVEKGSDEGKVL